jgi:beta-glucosidase
VKVRTILKGGGVGIAALFVVLVAGAGLWMWWSHPKRGVNGAFVARAGPGVFTFADVPRGRELGDSEVEGYVERLLREMTLEEKAAQMSGDDWLWDLVRLVLFERFKYNDRPIPSGAERRLRIPPVLFADGPRGVVLNHSTAFPVAMARAASFDRALEGRVADAIGQELRAQGANFFGGLCINLLRHPGWGRAQETYGEDPWVLGEMAATLVPAVQRHNVMACAKHFALNSIEESRNTVDVRADERTLREVYLPHFRRAVDAGVASVMSAYNRVNGDYCGENRWLLTTVLKQEWGFRGFVISDFFEGIYDGRKAARAGLDIEMPLAVKYGQRLVRAVESDEVPRAIIDEAVRRILRTKIRFLTRPDPMTYDASMIVSAEHVALAREVAEKSIVLLKNDHALLPLDKSRVHTLAVLGRLADAPNLGDHGSSRVYPPRVVTPLAGLREYLGEGTRVVHESAADPARARQAAREADAVVVVAGLDQGDEGEWIPQKPEGERGGDRRRLSLKPAEIELIRAASSENRQVVVVLIGGAAITVEEWKTGVDGILMAFYPGMEGGRALSRILFGDVSPSAKLPFTVPADTAWLPPFNPDAHSADYGYYHGYMLAEKRGIEPAFAFGFGLSYTRFRYGNLKLKAGEIAGDGVLEVSVEVTNAGSRAGDEIVELYVGFPNAKVDRPVKLLRGFEKVALAPGETKALAMSVQARDLAYWDTAAKGWRVEAVPHDVYVGSSSRKGDLLKATFRITEARSESAW